MSKIGDWAEEHKSGLQNFGIALGILGAGLGLSYAVATKGGKEKPVATVSNGSATDAAPKPKAEKKGNPIEFILSPDYWEKRNSVKY